MLEGADREYADLSVTKTTFKFLTISSEYFICNYHVFSRLAKPIATTGSTEKLGKEDSRLMLLFHWPSLTAMYRQLVCSLPFNVNAIFSQ